MWTTVKTLRLIEGFHAAVSLWDISCREYRDKNKKNDDLYQLAQELETRVEDIKKKIKSLKTQFRREHKKIAQKCRSGADLLSPDKCTWFGYNHLQFLIENNESKGSRNTLQIHKKDNDTISTASNSGSDESLITERDYMRKVSEVERRQVDLKETNNSQAASTSKSDKNTEKQGFVIPKIISVTPRRTKRKLTVDNRVDEAYEFIKRVKDKADTRDDHTIYGEYVASRLRNATQTYRAVVVAKHHIDTILFNLEMGAYDTHKPIPSPLGSPPYQYNYFPTRPSSSFTNQLSNSPSPSPGSSTNQSYGVSDLSDTDANKTVTELSQFLVMSQPQPQY